MVLKSNAVDTITQLRTWMNLVVLLMTATALLLPIGCRDNNPSANTGDAGAQSTASTTGSSQPGADSRSNANTTSGPRLTFETHNHNFGRILDIEPTTYGFQFTNTGDEVLVIEDVKPSCGCTVAELEKNRFQPGEGSTLRIEFTPRGGGVQSKSITVLSNDRTGSPIRLTITADVTPFVRFEPDILRLNDVTMGETYKTTVDVFTHDPSAEILSVEGAGGDGHVSALLLPDTAQPSAEQSGPRKIEVTIDDGAPWGTLYGSVAVRVRGRAGPDDERVNHQARLSLVAQVFGEIRATDSNFRIGTVRSGRRFNAVVKLYRPSGEPFEITNLVVQPQQMPGVQVAKRRIENDPSTPGFGYELILTGDTTGYTGVIGGDVIVETNLPGEERLEMRYFGRVR